DWSSDVCSSDLITETKLKTGSSLGKWRLEPIGRPNSDGPCRRGKSSRGLAPSLKLPGLEARRTLRGKSRLPFTSTANRSTPRRTVAAEWRANRRLPSLFEEGR